MREWIPRVLGVALALALVGCAAGPSIDGDRAFQLSGEAEDLYMAGDYAGAYSTYGLAIEELKPYSPQYYTDLWYVQHAAWRANQATLHLFRDEPELAKQSFLEVPTILQQGQEGHLQQVQNQNEVRQGIGALLTLGAAAAGGYYAGTQAATPEQVQMFTSSLVDLTSSVTEAMAMDPMLLGSGAPTDVEIDYVRMPAFLNIGYLSAIGRVVAGNRLCTGAFIHEYIVLTAAHCVTDESGRLDVMPAEISFQLWNLNSERALVEGTPTWSTTVNRIVLSPDYTGGSDWRNDWALLVTDEGSGNVFGWDGEGETVGTRLVIAGYSSDLNNGRFLTMDYGCELKSVDGDILRHNCAGFRGASGAPILLASEDRRLNTVIGVEACGERLSDDPAEAAIMSRTMIDRSLRDACGASMTTIWPHLRQLQIELESGF